MEAEVLPPMTDIISAVFDNPAVAFTDKNRADAFLAAVRAETDKLEADVDTTKGREAIRAMATKVTRSKAAIDKARLAMTKDLRDQVAQINEAGGRIVRTLDSLAEEVRKPLTDWEDAEKAREKRATDLIAWLKQAAVVTIADTSESVRERGNEVYEKEITKDQFGKLYLDAKELQQVAIDVLGEAMKRLEQEEADRAELARLRKDREEREAAEQAERAAQEEKDRADRAAREAEEARAREAEAERQRIARAQEQAAETARQEAAAAARREIDAANARAAEAERAAQTEREEREAADRARVEAARREAEEQARRERNRAHRAQVMAEIKVSIMAAGGITEEQAVAIVKAMTAGSVARVRVEF